MKKKIYSDYTNLELKRQDVKNNSYKYVIIQ